jgi:hypothetical protein
MFIGINILAKKLAIKITFANGFSFYWIVENNLRLPKFCTIFNCLIGCCKHLDFGEDRAFLKRDV